MQASDVPQSPDRVEIYIQPVFTVHQKTDVTSVVTWVHLSMTPLSQTNSAPPYFYWQDVVGFVHDPETDKINARFSYDAAPFVVTQDHPRASILRFAATRAFLTMGRWEWTLTAERQGQPSLVAEFCIDIPAANIFGTTSGLIAMSNDQSPRLPSSPPTSNCYRQP